MEDMIAPSVVAVVVVLVAHNTVDIVDICHYNYTQKNHKRRRRRRRGRRRPLDDVERDDPFHFWQIPREDLREDGRIQGTYTLKQYII